MGNQSTFVKEFAALKRQCEVKDPHLYFNEDNQRNARADLLNTIDRIDSDVRQGHIDACFSSNDVDLMDAPLTTYGHQLVLARYCAGWLGNLKQDDDLDAAKAQALVLIYAAYWH